MTNNMTPTEPKPAPIDYPFITRFINSVNRFHLSPYRSFIAQAIQGIWIDEWRDVKKLKVVTNRKLNRKEIRS